jgi:hypothetical protein
LEKWTVDPKVLCPIIEEKDSKGKVNGQQNQKIKNLGQLVHKFKEEEFHSHTKVEFSL